MNRIIYILGAILFITSSLFYATVMPNALAQTPDNTNVSLVSHSAEQASANSFDNLMLSLKTRRFSCKLNKAPDAQYEAVYATSQNVSELTHIHAPAVFGAGKYVWASDGFSLYQFEYSGNASHSLKLPSFTSKIIIVGITEQSVIQKHIIDKKSCVTSAPLTNPSNESTIYCSENYFKAQYYNNAVYILSDIPCKNDKSNKNCKDKSVSLERYTLDGTSVWSTTLNKMPSSSIVGQWSNIILILNSNASLIALDTETGAEIYRKDEFSELELDKEYYQFNHFYVDKEAGLFIVASRYHNKLTVIDIKTGAIVKIHDFGKAYAHNKFLEEDYHYIELGDFSFPLNTIMGIDNGVIYIRKDKNILAALDLKTGNQLWKYDIYNSPLNTNSTQNRDDIAYHVGDILITDDLVMIGYHKFATALNKKTGTPLWNYQFFPFNGYFGYQMWLSCIDDHLLIQSDNIYLY